MGGESYLKEMRPDGTIREIWDCRAWTEGHGVDPGDSNTCYTNTINWSPLTDSVLMSFPGYNTVVEIDRGTGELVSQWGDLPGSDWTFSPDSWSFVWNHFANISVNGTLFVSSHMPGHEDTEDPGEHRFMEFTIDRENRVLIENWMYGEGIDDWPMYKGEAFLMDNGNILGNYGTGGIIREITPEMETAWHVKWDADFSDDHFNRMVGHNLLVDDLYALCRGWEEN